MKNILSTNKRGFTLLELLIVVAIIGSLAAIAIPKFAEMVAKAQESSTKGGLGALRSTIMIYYADVAGIYPSALDGVLTRSAKYINVMPRARRPTFHTDSTIEYVDTTASVCGTELAGRSPPGDPNIYGWCYRPQGVAQEGLLLVNCNHADSKGVIWTRY